MDTLLKIKTGKPRNFVAMDLRTPKYRMKVTQSKKLYNRQSEKFTLIAFVFPKNTERSSLNTQRELIKPSKTKLDSSIFSAFVVCVWGIKTQFFN